jgi:catechol 2,3-dioxygenase-like lactoylglutathione lyase family enzyme
MSDPLEPKADFWTKPIFSVANLQASIEYYETKLGFTLRWRSGESAAEVERAGINLVLSCGSNLPSSRVPGVISAELYDHIQLDQLHADFVLRGASVCRAPFPVGWQPRVHQLEIADLDGNILLFWGDLP